MKPRTNWGRRERKGQWDRGHILEQKALTTGLEFRAGLRRDTHPSGGRVEEKKPCSEFGGKNEGIGPRWMEKRGSLHRRGKG